MNHREKMQIEAEQWQEKSVKIIQAVRYGVLAFGILMVLVLVLRNLGFPKKIDEAYAAAVITESGQMMECTLEIRGEITDYPLNKNKAGINDNVVIYANGKRLLLVSLYGDRSTGCIFTQNQNAVCLMSVLWDAVVLETDLKVIFPEMENQRCLVYYGYDSFDLPGEYAAYFTFLQELEN